MLTVNFASWWIPLLITILAFGIPLWWSIGDSYGIGFLFGIVPWSVISIAAWVLWGFLR